MYCPFCGWDLIPYRIKHGVHKIAYQCENDVCTTNSQFIVIEVLGRLPKDRILGRSHEHTRKEQP